MGIIYRAVEGINGVAVITKNHLIDVVLTSSVDTMQQAVNKVWELNTQAERDEMTLEMINHCGGNPEENRKAYNELREKGELK